MIASDWDFARSDLRSAQVPSRSDRTLLVGESFARQLLQKISKPTMQSQMKLTRQTWIGDQDELDIRAFEDKD
ncbi:MAG: hypothetical protein FRX49_08877 [Trebouxia sp. A1-2]|nr:MAG: hypothetical protein FRX49_08877 [Trebouxia sp. A1-2]